MEVSAFGTAVKFADVAPGELFLAYRSSKPPLVCIKITPAKEQPCAMLFDESRKSPAIVYFGSWFQGDEVLRLDRARLVLGSGPTDFASSYDFVVGHIIMASTGHYMMIRDHQEVGYLDLSNGQIHPKSPIDLPWPICHRWSVQWDKPDMVEIPSWTFGS